MTTIDRSIEGPHFASCNCDHGCPCQFVALPVSFTDSHAHLSEGGLTSGGLRV